MINTILNISTITNKKGNKFKHITVRQSDLKGLRDGYYEVNIDIVSRIGKKLDKVECGYRYCKKMFRPKTLKQKFCLPNHGNLENRCKRENRFKGEGKK